MTETYLSDSYRSVNSIATSLMANKYIISLSTHTTLVQQQMLHLTYLTPRSLGAKTKIQVSNLKLPHWHLSAVCCSVSTVSLPVFVTKQSLSSTPGPTRHNIYSSQAVNAAPLLLSQFKHSISLTRLGCRANTLVDSKGFSWVVCCCLKCASLFSLSLPLSAVVMRVTSGQRQR